MNPHCLAMFLALFICSNVLAADATTSKYTSTERGKSARFQEDTEDPTGFRATFRGFGGYDLEHVGGDERSWINLFYGGKRVDLLEATLEIGAGAGAFPHKANDVVEWRGTEAGGKFKPYAVIYRIAGLDENGRRKKTRLIVIRLDGAKSRIIGHADEPGAEKKARALADRLR